MYALKFISGKYQGGEFPLKLNRQILIGRSSDLDMVLVEDMVSRKHAKITCQDGKVYIEDLGSTNGTFVNGEKTRQARLKEGDRILIGTSILKLVAQGIGQNLDDSLVKKRLEEAAEAAAARQTRSISSMTGKIDEVPLPDLLQLFGTSKKSGVLHVRGAMEAHIFLRQGRVYYSVIDGQHSLGPRKSFFRIVAWESGDFELLPPDDQEFAVELESSTEALLMEGLRQLDELRRIQEELPHPSSVLELAYPLVSKLRELSEEELDLLQTIHNEKSLQPILDKAAGTDLEICSSLLELVKKGYVSVCSDPELSPMVQIS